jgi:hypothetical protein
MQGLLDFLKTPAGQGLLATGLGAAASAGRGRGLLGNLGTGGLMGLQAFSGAQSQEAELAERQKMGQYRDAQMKNVLAEAAAREAELARKGRLQSELPNLFKGGGMSGGQPMPQEVGGVPMFSQPMGAAPMQQAPAGFDIRKAIELGMSPDEIQKYVGLQDAGKPKATRQLEVDDGKGGKRLALVDDFGREVAGYAGYTAPVQVNRGDRVDFVKPAPGVSLGVNMSPEARASNALGWANHGLTKRGQDMTDARARETANAGKVPAGYRLNADGTMSAIPGGPADLKAVLGLLDEVDALLPKATGSYLGAGVDQAARVFGASTDGADATAQLKTLQGALIGKMPKMAGPQSDKDVQLYREMAGQVGDPTLPVGTRQKASETIRRLNEKYAGMGEGASRAGSPPPTPMKGMVRNGYRFKGGDPSKQENWEKQ